jgi:tRNA pseudouridine38-40 synthase
MPSFRCTLAYDGTQLCGSQAQPGQRTVQGELERALGTLVPGAVSSIFAGRTDRGVHSVGQVAALRLSAWRATAEDLERAVNARLPRDIAASNVAQCHDDFNPRYDAIWREYRYYIAPGVASPFLGRYAWATRAPVDAKAVDAAARRLIGTHDFAAFASGGEGVPWSERARRPRGATRTILRCACRRMFVSGGPWGDLRAETLEIRVAADGFLPRMVRNIVGALVEIGQGRQREDWIDGMLAARDRRLGPVSAPSHGLTLWRVGFGGDELDDWEISAPSGLWVE